MYIWVFLVLKIDSQNAHHIRSTVDSFVIGFRVRSIKGSFVIGFRVRSTDDCLGKGQSRGQRLVHLRCWKLKRPSRSFDLSGCHKFFRVKCSTRQFECPTKYFEHFEFETWNVKVFLRTSYFYKVLLFLMENFYQYYSKQVFDFLILLHVFIIFELLIDTSRALFSIIAVWAYWFRTFSICRFL